MSPLIFPDKEDRADLSRIAGLLQQLEIFQRRARFLRCFMQDGPPAAHRTRRRIFRPVVQVDDFRAAPPGQLFQRFVNSGFGFHGADFARINVAAKGFEERKISLDMFDRQIIRI